MPSRCFLAIDLVEPCRDALSSARDALLDSDPSWAKEKWVRDGDRHVTVKFIGPVPDDRLDALVETIGRVAADHAPLELRLTGLRAVPSARRARMLWADMDCDDGTLSALAADIDRTLGDEFGVDSDGRPFAAHVTLARSRRPRPVRDEALGAGALALTSGEPSVRNVSVPSVTLYSSTLSPDGPTYEVISTIPLGGGCQTERV